MANALELCLFYIKLSKCLLLVWSLASFIIWLLSYCMKDPVMLDYEYSQLMLW